MSDPSFIEDARNGFLVAVESVAGTVLEDLAGEPRRCFSLAHKAVRRSFRWHPQAAELRDALDRWSRRWHLEADWCLETALDTLRDWEIRIVDPEGPHRLDRLDWWTLRHAGWMQGDLPAPPAAWTPYGNRGIAEARHDFENYAEAVRKELAAQERDARAAGLPVNPARFTPETIERAVRFQILAEPIARIARGDPKNTSASIYAFLEFIGLPARRAPRGRPPGSTSHAGVAAHAGSNRKRR